MLFKVLLEVCHLDLHARVAVLDELLHLRSGRYTLCKATCKEFAATGLVCNTKTILKAASIACSYLLLVGEGAVEVDGGHWREDVVGGVEQEVHSCLLQVIRPGQTCAPRVRQHL